VLTDHIPPPPAGRPNYLLYGLGGLIIGLSIVVVILVLTSTDEASTDTTVAATDTTAGTESTITPPTNAAPTTTAAETTTTAGAAFAGDTSSKVAPGNPFATFAFLDDIRFAQRDEGFTRVVFDFEGTDVPWWSVGYASGPFTNLGDEPIPVAGGAFLQVDLASTSYDLSGAEMRLTYEGADRIAVNSTSVVEVVRLEDFEGVSSWVIGVTSEKPFLVGTLTNPPRVFADIQD
jgi:hypothetical protein